MSEPLRILYLEDDPDFPALVKDLLNQGESPVDIELVDNYAEFVTRLDTKAFDLILCDYHLPTCSGFEAIDAARTRAPETPLLLISGVISDEAAIKSLDRGATDYILKNRINRLVPAVNRAITESKARQRSAHTLKTVQAELQSTKRLAEMAEMATSVLHNVGNVLNSVNVSVSLVSDELKKSKMTNLTRVAALLREHQHDIGEFIASDPKGQKLPDYLNQLAEHLAGEQTALLHEMEEIRNNVEHIKEIVALQQSYARVSGVAEAASVSDLLEDALRMNADALARHQVEIVREYASHLPEIRVERHKVLQILVNLIRNAKYACDESRRPDKRLILRATNGGSRVRISVIDNGVGISAENLGKLFNYGFTTRKNGHGFGLHSSAQAAAALGGALRAQSDGPGKGAAFTLELPVPAANH